ncbi:MAG: ATP-binding cassette domain-containing protein, partial [Candidatus Eisenbacteria bacterium]
MITFEQVSKRYGERLALDSVSWHMNEGECVVFLGHSGAGKTTILRLITHETQPSLGSVTVGTFTGGRLPRAHRALLRRTLGIVYEDFRLLHDRTVFENVALPVRVAGRFADEEVIPRVLFALEEVGLQLKQDAFPAELSAGEKQKAAIARAIVNRPAVILADEPTGALEKKSAEEVLLLLKRIHAEGAALLLVTTRHEVADALPARVLQLDDGHLVGGDAGMPPAPAVPGLPAAEAASGGSPGAIDEWGESEARPASRVPAREASGGSPGAIDEWGESEATGTREER